MTAAHRLAAALAVGLLTGCAGLRTADAPPTGWQSGADSLQQIDHWTLGGRVASRGGPDAESFSGNLRWVQAGDRFEIDISGPLGIGGYQAAGGADGVVVSRGDRYWSIADPDAFLAEALGWDFPFDAFRYWVLGLPMPGLARELEFDEDGRLIVLRQAGWTLSYTRHRLFAGYLLPGRITVVPTTSAAAADVADPSLRVRVVIDQWSPAG